MPNLRITMQKLKKLIELTIAGQSQRAISTIIGVHRQTVVNYQVLLKTYADGELLKLENLEESQLWKIVTLEENPTVNAALIDHFPDFEKRLSKVGVNKRFLWEEHCRQKTDQVSYSQFCRLFSKWEGTTATTMHIEHKAGDKLYIDFAGSKLHITDSITGIKTPVEVFIAVLGYSQLTYCQAVHSQKKVDFLLAISNSLTFFGGVPLAIVPDNLKSAVNKASKYEPEINESLAEFGEHYQTTIYPTRGYKPKDKALVEKTVSILYTRIYAVLADKPFYSLNALNEAIRLLLVVHNTTLFQGKAESRQMRFDEIERQTLQILPASRFELKSFRIAKVHPDCHVKLAEDNHYYSVPYKYVGLKVKIRYSAEIIEIYYQYQRIAIHKRLTKIGSYTTLVEHLPPNQQWVKKWSVESFLSQAEKIGENTLKAITQVLYSKKYPEQSYKKCAGILALARQIDIGKTRLEDACERALVYDFITLKIVRGILDTALDKVPLQPEKEMNIIPLHANIRGSSNYK